MNLHCGLGSVAISNAKWVGMGAELLRVSGLRRRFGDHEVLHGASLAGGPGLLGDVLADRRLLTLRIRRPRSLPAGRVRALLAGEVRTARNGRAGGVLLVAVLGVYAATVIIPRGGCLWWCCCALCRRCPVWGGVPVDLPVTGVAADARWHRPHPEGHPSGVTHRRSGGVRHLLNAPAVPTARWVALAITPVGVIANLWLRTMGNPRSRAAWWAISGTVRYRLTPHGPTCARLRH